jgi:molybdopterin-guanine dinucleotide biosynthesis protein MobB
MFDHLPIVGVCGWSGAGKTTLLERVVPMFVGRGLTVAIVKHDVHGITTEPDAKDSARLFRVGADVFLHGLAQSMARQVGNLSDSSVESQVFQLAARYDLVLVEGFKDAPWPKVWIMADEHSGPPDAIRNVVAVLPRDGDQVQRLSAMLDEFLHGSCNRAPLFGCVLIGGRSSRMGSPKHLLPSRSNGRGTWLEDIIGVLRPICRQIVIAGAGAVPAALEQLPRIPDVPEISGPMAGLLAAMRWAPLASWLLVACDLPYLSAEAVQWLLDQRSPGNWAILPDLAGSFLAEPLLAFYDFRLRPHLEELARFGRVSLHDVVDHPKTLRATAPPELAQAWWDVDTTEERSHYGD